MVLRLLLAEKNNVPFKPCTINYIKFEQSSYNFVIIISYVIIFIYSASQKPRSTKSYSKINLLGLRTVYIVVFLCCSVLSLFSYGLLYSICLLYIVVNNDLLQRALQSVTKNGTAELKY